MYGSTIPLSGTLGQAGSSGVGTLWFDSPTDILGDAQGKPDGIALISPTGAIIQLLSYGGSAANPTVQLADGPAAGLVTKSIGVDGASVGAATGTLALTGTGSAKGDFTWKPTSTTTKGAVNTQVGQTFVAAQSAAGADGGLLSELASSALAAQGAPLTIGVAAGGGAGAVVALVCLVAFALWLRYRRRQKRTFRSVYVELATLLGDNAAREFRHALEHEAALARWRGALRKGQARVVDRASSKALAALCAERFPYSRARGSDAEAGVNRMLMELETEWSIAVVHFRLQKAVEERSTSRLRTVCEAILKRSQAERERGLDGSRGNALVALLAPAVEAGGRLDGRTWALLAELNRLAEPRLAIPDPGESSWHKAAGMLQRGKFKQLAVESMDGGGPASDEESRTRPSEASGRRTRPATPLALEAILDLNRQSNQLTTSRADKLRRGSSVYGDGTPQDRLRMGHDGRRSSPPQPLHWENGDDDEEEAAHPGEDDGMLPAQRLPPPRRIRKRSTLEATYGMCGGDDLREGPPTSRANGGRSSSPAPRRLEPSGRRLSHQHLSPASGRGGKGDTSKLGSPGSQGGRHGDSPTAVTSSTRRAMADRAAAPSHLEPSESFEVWQMDTRVEDDSPSVVDATGRPMAARFRYEAEPRFCEAPARIGTPSPAGSSSSGGEGRRRSMSRGEAMLAARQAAAAEAPEQVQYI